MRQPQRVWKTFYRLKLRANFFVGNRVFEKTSFCTARSFGPGTVTHEVFAPWTVVRSDEYVNKKITVNKSAETVRVCPSIEDSIRACGHIDLECPRVEQPNSDNGVKGPTS